MVSLVHCVKLKLMNVDQLHVKMEVHVFNPILICILVCAQINIKDHNALFLLIHVLVIHVETELPVRLIRF